MAKYAANSNDPYLDPETGILKNRQGIKYQPTLDKVESGYSFLRSEEMKNDPAPEKLDFSHMKSINHRLFGDVYEWAGQVRSVDISKGNTRFASTHAIEREGTKLLTQLNREQYLRGLNADEFSRRAGHYLGEINVLHPFREGNGRTQREFINQLAKQAGYQILWVKVSRDEMTQASIEAYHGDSGRMAKLIRENLVDKDYQHANELAKEVAGDKARLVRAESGKSYSGRLIGHTDRYVIQERAESPSEMILHNRRSLSSDIAKLRDSKVEISYPHGDVGLVRSSHDSEKSKVHKEIQKEQKLSEREKY